jgi:hypothetical protein
MSLTARSALGGLPKAQDENPQFAAKQAKSTTTNGARRGAAALSDITNVAGLANAGGLTQKQGNQRTTRSTATNTRPTTLTQNFASAFHEDAMMVDEPFEPVQTEEAMELTQAWTDIDEMDHQDPQAVTPYVEEIYQNCREKEVLYSVIHNYMLNQSDINEKMRYVLVNWLVEVHLKFKLLPETMGLAVNLVDRFLSKHSIGRDNLQLVGITCMFLAAKYEEIYPPECNDFVYISASVYTREQILAMESTILNAVEFNLTVPTSLHFLRRFSKAAGSDYPTHTLCKYFLELALVDMRMNAYYPSATAAAAVYLARIINNGTPDWNATLVHYTEYDEAAVYPIAQELLKVTREAQTSHHQAVVRKYQTRKFGEVARRSLPATI